MNNLNTSTSEEGKELLPVKEGETTKPAEGAEETEVKKVEEAPKLKTYSEEEWNKRQSSWDKDIAQRDKEHQETLKTIKEEHDRVLREQDEQRAQEFLKKVEEDGGDVSKARTLIEREQKLKQREREAEAFEQAIKAKAIETAKDLKEIQAHKLAALHGVPVDELLKAESPEDMKEKALLLEIEKLKEAKKAPVKTDSGVSTGKAVDFDKLTFAEQVERVWKEPKKE